MSSYVPAHPLDVDLADFVESTLDPERAARVEAHLDTCLLCRVKSQRLRAAPPLPLRFDAPLGAAPFRVPPAEDGVEPGAGDLWLAGEDDRILVLVRAVVGDRVVVMPVTFDVEAADDETVILGATSSVLDVELAVYPQLATELPRAALWARVAALAASPDLAGDRRGTPITDASDPRLDVRQFLADRLGAIEATPPDPGTAADAPPMRPEQVRSALMADLRAFRGETCRVRPVSGEGLVRHPGWTPLLAIDEVGIVLVVLDTPQGLNDDDDFDAARAVLTRLNATALVVLAREVSDLAEVFDSASLNYGIDTPSGAHSAPRPLISGLSAFDAIAKFLDQHTGVRMMAPPSRASVGHVDVAEMLRDATAAALAEVVRQGGRFKIAPKRRGYESLAAADDAVQDALGRAFSGESVVEPLLDLSRVRPNDGEG